jgi:hypothetical protein
VAAPVVPASDVFAAVPVAAELSVFEVSLAVPDVLAP